MFDKNTRIEGKKTIIRPFTEGDINATYISWLNDSIIMQYSNQRFLTHSKMSCLDYLKSFRDTTNSFFAIEDSDSNKLIGTMTVYFSEINRVADVGILIGDTKAAGKGYGKDSWCSMTEWLKNRAEVRKITAGTVSINKPMLALMSAANMAQDGCRRRHQIIQGHEVDVMYFAIFNDV